MIVETATVRLFAPWVHSLKEKRMVVKSLIAKVRHTYPVAAAEVEEQDIHQVIVLGLACVADTAKHAGQVMDAAVSYIESHTEAEVTHVEREIR